MRSSSLCLLPHPSTLVLVQYGPRMDVGLSLPLDPERLRPPCYRSATGASNESRATSRSVSAPPPSKPSLARPSSLSMSEIPTSTPSTSLPNQHYENSAGSNRSTSPSVGATPTSSPNAANSRTRSSPPSTSPPAPGAKPTSPNPPTRRCRGSGGGPGEVWGEAGSVEHDHFDEGFGVVERRKPRALARMRPMEALLDSEIPLVRRHSIVASIEAR